MAGCDGRYEPLAEDGYETPELREAWYAGWQDAMDAEDDEEAEPDAAGYGQ
jgi:ribosome modulation factor